MLYQSFILKCGFEKRYGMFGAGILHSEGFMITDFLGEESSLDSSKESIIDTFKAIDKYCRMRLPDKYLIEFDKAYKED